MKVICISGKAQHGKDTTASFLKERLEDQGYDVLVAHYGDLVKYICKTFFGWNGQKDEYGRGLLQYVGTDVIREQEPDFWVNFLAKMLHFFREEWDYVLIPDSRFPNEIDYLRDAGLDVTHLRVIREHFQSPLTEEQQRHPSETALDHVTPDFYIHNNGTLDDLKAIIRDWLSEFQEHYQISFDDITQQTIKV